MSEDNSTVTYKDLPGFPGYRVGDDGSVWTCRKRVKRGVSKGCISVLTNEWRRMKPVLDTGGYPRYHITGWGNWNKARAHELVLTAFIGPCPPGMVGRHFPDRDRTNNRLENLQWGTQAENVRDQLVHGTDNRGERNGRATLTDELVRQIRARHAERKGTRNKAPRGTCETLAADFGLPLSTIYYVVCRQRWAHVA